MNYISSNSSIKTVASTSACISVEKLDLLRVPFNGKGTNLHSLWDSGLISKEGKGFEVMAKDYDTATPAEIKKWQGDDLIHWLWESYQFSTKIYGDVKKNNVLGMIIIKQIYQ